MGQFPKPLARLVDELIKLPGIGPKTAQRIALAILEDSPEYAYGLANAIVEARKKTTYCKTCYNLSDKDFCFVCQDIKRNAKQICVVEDPRDVLAIERTHAFHGHYHVLGGAIRPLEGIGPGDIRVKELMNRLSEETQEVVLATNPNVEGEATALYLVRLIKPLGIPVTRIAKGVPVGSDLEYIDEITLSKSLEGRRTFE